MPEILFKGKEYVYNHHLTVPYRPLVANAAKGIGPADLAGNLIIHGDNLHALKAFLPRYAGQVDLIFIDPPYNTGDEGWCYNDNVNSPIMKEWLSTNPVDGEDMLRRDKWLAMMWPRLTLLRELLSERGSIWITLDDNEVHRARMVLDEIFGEENFLASVVWEKADSPKMDVEFFSTRHDHMLVYANNIDTVTFKRLLGEPGEVAEHYDKVDSGGNKYCLKPLRAMGGQGETKEARPNLHYGLTAPDGTIVFPRLRNGADGAWRWSKEKTLAESDRIEWKRGSNGWSPYLRIVADLDKGRPPETIFYNHEVGSSRTSKLELRKIFGSEEVFATPKPSKLIERVLDVGANRDSLILDSFAGSGTTAHAVLKANANDDGTRKFILVEGEDYADRLTAERVRRAINGYAWVGTSRETLLEEKITWTQFKKADEWQRKVEANKVKEGFGAEVSPQMELVNSATALTPTLSRTAGEGARQKKRFDKINVELKDGLLRVEGAKRISERVDGLGGAFTYCTLGEPLDIQKLLSGESLPAFDALGAWLFHTATGGTLLPAPKDAPTYYLGEARDAHVWLMYEPNLSFLKSADAALTLSRARSIADWGRAHLERVTKSGGSAVAKRHLVFAPAKYISNKQLTEHGIDFAPLPFALYRQG